MNLSLPGRPKVSIIDKINNYHSLSAFLDWSLTNQFETRIKYNTSAFGQLKKGPERFHRLFELIKIAERKKPIMNTQELDKLETKKTGLRV